MGKGQEGVVGDRYAGQRDEKKNTGKSNQIVERGNGWEFPGVSQYHYSEVGSLSSECLSLSLQEAVVISG